MPRAGPSVEPLAASEMPAAIPAPETEGDSIFQNFIRLGLLVLALAQFFARSFLGTVMYIWSFRSRGNASLMNRQKAVQDLETALTYEQWEVAAAQFDKMQGKDQWRSISESALYDSRLLEHRLINLRALSNEGDVHALILAIREGMLRNLGGMGDAKLFEYCLSGTKTLIEEYTEEVAKQLEIIASTDYPDLSPEKKFDLFYELKQSYGRSALLLSGGVTFATYHVGVIQGLWEQNLLPRVISGSSAGSIVAALFCTRTDEELPSLFGAGAINLAVFEQRKKGSMKRKLKRLLQKGVLMDISVLQAAVRSNLGDITFKEAYNKTKRILNISISSTDTYESTRLLNYITAPSVLIWSAALASCALPFMFEPVELLAKDRNGNIVPYHPAGQKWMDGSVGADLPMGRLSELFNVNHFIVSQVNPHIAPFLYQMESRKGGFVPAMLYLLKSELKHRVTQLAELGLIPLFLKNSYAILKQQYHGDITIVPEVGFKDYSHLISNPIAAMVEECISKGKRSTWAKVPVIKNHCRIETVLDKSCAKLLTWFQNDESGRKLSKRLDKILTEK